MADSGSEDEDQIAPKTSRKQSGGTSENSSSSVVTVSSDSWEKIERISPDELRQTKPKMLDSGDQREYYDAPPRPDVPASETGSARDRFEFSQAAVDSESNEAKHRGISTTSSREKHFPDAAFDGRQATVYHVQKDRIDETHFGDKITKPAKNVLSRKRAIDETSALVNGDTPVGGDFILPAVPADPFRGDDYSTASASKELPPGIGTGEDKIGKDVGSCEEGENNSMRLCAYSDSVKGLSLAFIGAGVMYGVTSVLVRLAGENGFGSVQVLFLRSIFQSILMGSILLCKGAGLRPPPGRTIRCVFIAITYCLATFASYEAFNLIRPGSAIASRAAARTIFSLILSYLVTKEKLRIGDLLTLFCCIGGIAMIVSSALTSGQTDYILPPGMSDDPTTIRIYGYSLIIAAGLCRSLGLIAVRGAKEDLSALSVVFYHSSLAVLLTVILLATLRQPTWPPSWAGVGFAVGVCVASALATWSSNQAVKYVHPALANLGQNADVVVSIALEHAILQMVPRALEVCGAGLILLGVCGLTVYKWLESRKENYAKLDS